MSTASVLIDRLGGGPPDPAKPLLPARCRLTADLVVNGHTRLGAGEVLLEDGSGQWRFDPPASARACGHTPRDAELALALEAVATIDRKTDAAAGHLPSPLLPAEVVCLRDADELEIALDEVFARGHLETIDRHPRLTMRYDTTLLPIERAKRLDAGFQRHLAAHSECWASRTLSGIVPKRVLARISEDEADRYEHRVYARLLDRLERTLGLRLARLRALDRSLAQGLDFEGSECVDYRLLHDICSVWGEAQDGIDCGEQRRSNAGRIEHLERRLQRLRRLRSGALYAAIARSAEVGLSLKPTNLLQHDPHYRALQRLWNAWLEASSAERERPRQVLERRCAEQAAYERYVGLLLRRGLRAFGFELEASDELRLTARHDDWQETVTVRCHQHDWQLECAGRQLVLVPAAIALDADAHPQWRTCVQPDGTLRVPCVLRTPSQDRDGPDARLAAGAAALTLSPLEIYAEETVITLLAGWLWQARVAGYGEVFGRLPQAVCAAWPEPIADDRAVLTRVPDAAARSRLEAALATHANAKLRERINARLRQLQALDACPDCRKPARRFSPQDGGFHARCDCGCVWQLRDGRFALMRADPSQAGFARLGRRRLDVSLADTAARPAAAPVQSAPAR